MMLAASPNAPAQEATPPDPDELMARVAFLEGRVQAGDQRRRAMVNIMKDLAESNRRLNDQRRAMLHILADYEKDRKDLARQTERLNNSRRALMHILQDAHQSNERLGQSRKAMIHIMGDLRETTEQISRREHELREKQEQLVQAAKLATLGELTTGVAHELNNPLNNIGLYLGNMLDRLQDSQFDREHMERDLHSSMQQVSKATEIIDHLRTFGRAAPTRRDALRINEVIVNATSLLREQLRLRDIELVLTLTDEDPVVSGNAIQIEQVLMNLLTNARDAVSASETKRISITTAVDDRDAVIAVEDTGPGVPADLEQRVFDPFFTTKEVGEGTGLGLSIVYGIIKEHEGAISVERATSQGARFVVQLPLAEVTE
jgi:C4-dicarboxylate-specific signal transduction histidine kinase